MKNSRVKYKLNNNKVTIDNKITKKDKIKEVIRIRIKILKRILTKKDDESIEI